MKKELATTSSNETFELQVIPSGRSVHATIMEALDAAANHLKKVLKSKGSDIAKRNNQNLLRLVSRTLTEMEALRRSYAEEDLVSQLTTSQRLQLMKTYIASLSPEERLKFLQENPQVKEELDAK